MKKTILLLTALTMFLSIYAQEKVKQTQFGLVFNNLDNFGFTIKKGSNKFMWRFNTLLLAGDKKPIPIDSSTITNFGIGFSIGNEFKKKITENLEFYFGYDYSYSYYQSKEEHEKRYDVNIFKTTYKTPGFNLVFGFNCILKEHFVLGAELLPYFSRTRTSNYKHIDYADTNWELLKETKSFNYGISNSSARLLIAYRF